VRQPLLQNQGKGSMEELEALCSPAHGKRLHAVLRAIVEACGGKYLCGPRKSRDRCVQKVEDEYKGDYSKLMDLERATALFDDAEGMLHGLQQVIGGQEEEKGDGPKLTLVRCKDRLNSPLKSGYRDILLNFCDQKSGFVLELQLNFHKIAEIKGRAPLLPAVTSLATPLVEEFERREGEGERM